MTQETKELEKKINNAMNAKEEKTTEHEAIAGYQIFINLLTNLLGCVLIGASLGVFFQNMFNTSPVLTAALTILGGFAGLWTVVKYVMHLEKDNK